MNRVKKPDFATLLEEAAKLHINVIDQDAERLFYDLAGISELPEYNETYVHLRDVSGDERKRLREGNFTIPEKTLLPKKIKKRFLEIIAEKPLSYSGYDFTREKQVVHYTTTKSFTCYCGTKNDFNREYTDNKGNKHNEILDEVYCSNPDCLNPPIEGLYSQRHWFFIGK